MIIYFFDSDGRCLQALHSPSHNPDLIERWRIECGAQTAVLSELSFQPHEIFWKDGFIRMRPPCPAIFDADNRVLSLLPAPCAIIINGSVYDCAEELCQLNFDHPGSFAISVKKWPYLDGEYLIEVPL